MNCENAEKMEYEKENQKHGKVIVINSSIPLLWFAIKNENEPFLTFFPPFLNFQRFEISFRTARSQHGIQKFIYFLMAGESLSYLEYTC